jgi:hypothetical protein
MEMKAGDETVRAYKDEWNNLENTSKNFSRETRIEETNWDT